MRRRRETSGVGLGTEFRSEKIPRNRLGMVSVIPRKKVLIPRNSEFRGRANSENSENLHIFWFHGTDFRDVFSSAEGFGTELWEFDSIFVLRNGIPSYFLFRGRVRNGIQRFSVPRNNRNSVGNNHLFRLFRLPRNYFLSEIPNPNQEVYDLPMSSSCLHLVLHLSYSYLPSLGRPPAGGNGPLEGHVPQGADIAAPDPSDGDALTMMSISILMTPNTGPVAP
jgi:hypothetical protein